MGRTYWTGPPKWKCPKCGRVNTMRKGPAKGHSVRKKCSGCDKYCKVEGDPTLAEGIKVVGNTVVGIGQIIGDVIEASQLPKREREEVRKQLLESESSVWKNLLEDPKTQRKVVKFKINDDSISTVRKYKKSRFKDIEQISDEEATGLEDAVFSIFSTKCGNLIDQTIFHPKWLQKQENIADNIDIPVIRLREILLYIVFQPEINKEN